MKARVKNMPKIWGIDARYVNTEKWTWSRHMGTLIGEVIDVEQEDGHSSYQFRSDNGNLWLADWLDFDSVHEPCAHCGGEIHPEGLETIGPREVKTADYVWWCTSCDLRFRVLADSWAEAWEKLDRRTK